MEKELVIGHLFPELLNLYGDLGNITTLVKRGQWRGINTRVENYTIGHSIPFASLDIVLLGGGSDREQRLVCDYLRTMKDEIQEYVDSQGVLLAICGGYQLLGHHYQTNNSEIPGLGILDLYTEKGEGRLTGNVCLESTLEGSTFPVIGFENHAGRTFHNYEPLGLVKKGYGNNGQDGKEGLIYKNILGTYLHGPLLPKNPEIADYLLKRSLERKYGEGALAPLEDQFEREAKKVMLERLERGEF